MVATDREVAIDVRGIWTVFGPMAKRAMDPILRESLSKTEVRDCFNWVVGVRDASFTVGRGEIFCIMGLSGSGKSRLIRHINR